MTDKFPTVWIQWKDSQSPGDQSWYFLDQLNFTPSLIKSIGFLINETEDSMTLGLSVSDSDGVNGVITIPKVAILAWGNLSVTSNVVLNAPR